MHFLIVGINFYPELTGIGKYTGEMATWLSNQGHQVTVITAPPYYPHWQIKPGYRWWQYKRENWQGIHILRCPIWVPKKPSGLKRVLHLTSFAASSILALFSQIHKKPDLVFCVAPAITSAVPVLLYANLTGAKSWLHVQDFEIDAAIDLGILSKRNMLQKLAFAFERVILTQFKRVSTISKRMVARLESKGVMKSQIYLFPNWVDVEKIYPIKNGNNHLKAELHIPTNKVIVLYAGNMGKKQGLELLVDAAKILQKQPEIYFVLCGEGAVRNELELAARGLPNIVFHPLQPIEKLNQLLNLADIHLLPQRADVADLVMPSKLSGMLASGKVVIATAKPDTEVAETVKQTGIVIPPGQANLLAKAIQNLANHPEMRHKLGTKGRAFAEQYWAYEEVMGRFVQVAEQFIHSQ